MPDRGVPWLGAQWVAMLEKASEIIPADSPAAGGLDPAPFFRGPREYPHQRL